MLADTVPLYFPVHKAMNTAQNTHVKTLNHFAVPLDRVRAKEICQSNNEADVVVNLSVKFTQQTCGNYLCEPDHKEIRPKVPQVFDNPTRKMFLFLSQSAIKYENLLEYKINIRQALLRVA